MNFALPTQPTKATAPWLEHAVFGLDRWLRRWHGVYEYTADANCLFRIQRAKAEEHLTLSDGTRVASGDPILMLHLWNEHIPIIPQCGATIGWARQLSRGIDISLQHLARYLAAEPLLEDVVAIRADMRLGAGDQLARISAHFGFERASREIESTGTLHRFGENILIFMLVMAANPAAIRLPVLWCDRQLVYLSRRALERRYAACVNSPPGTGGGRLC